ncbi:hypothetical protein J3R30DRAFT_3427774 [Lentinula aciculospora]|uniref:Uncharacterized protein n=1 Tax=Lentinula aciculospora TaxID=153920 RepID=A0A9W9AWL8_9AGAR|nr:hypothetical protein J3R30DRAFT_3427774 [Lentinula aciculospora]
MTAQASYVDNTSLVCSGSGSTPGLAIRRRFTHRYTQSAPSALPLPSLSSSLTSRTANSSTLTTPTSDSYDMFTPSDIVPSLKIATSATSKVDHDFDIPTPKASPRTRSRIPVLLANRKRRSTAPTSSETTLDRVRYYSKFGQQRPRGMHRLDSSAIPVLVRGLKESTINSDSVIPSLPFATVFSSQRRDLSPVRSPSPSQPSRSKPTMAVSFISPDSPSSSTISKANSDVKMDIGRPHSHRKHLPSKPSVASDSALQKGSGVASCSRSYSTSLCCSPQLTSLRTSSSSTLSPNTGFAETFERVTLVARHASHGIHNAAFGQTYTSFHNPYDSSRAAERMLRSTLARDEAKVSNLSSATEKRRRHSLATGVESTNTLKPHEQVLRARLERVLKANTQADGREGELPKTTSRNPASTESVGSRRSRSRAGSDTTLLGWFWNKGSTSGDEYEDDETIALPVPPIACPHIQAFSQTPYLTRFSSPRQPALPTSSSASPPKPRRMRSHTSPVPSDSSVHSTFQSTSDSPHPPHALPLGPVPTVGAEVEAKAQGHVRVTGSSVQTSRATGPIQLQKTLRMPTPPPTPPPRSADITGESQSYITSSGSFAIPNRQSRSRRSTEPVHMGHHLHPKYTSTASNPAIHSSTPATLSTEAKSRRKSTPVAGSLQTVKSTDRRRSIPTSTGAVPEPSRFSPRNVHLSGQLGSVQRDSPTAKPTAVRTQHSRSSTMSEQLPSSLPSPSYLQNRHRLSTSSNGPLLPSLTDPTFHTTPPISSSSSPSSPSPTSPSLPPFHTSPCTTSAFNAHTASMRCRQIDGYVSFAAVAGLEEPHGDDDGVDGREGTGDDGDGSSAANLGWVGRLFGI